jgi:hypothetical protein
MLTTERPTQHKKVHFSPICLVYRQIRQKNQQKQVEMPTFMVKTPQAMATWIHQFRRIYENIPKNFRIRIQTSCIPAKK